MGFYNEFAKQTIHWTPTPALLFLQHYREKKNPTHFAFSKGLMTVCSVKQTWACSIHHSFIRMSHNNGTGMDFALTCTDPRSTIGFRFHGFTPVLIKTRTWYGRVLTLQLTWCTSVTNSLPWVLLVSRWFWI